MSEIFQPGPMRHIGDYLLIGYVGGGGMGEVWQACQVSLNRTVALKLISAGRLARPEQIQRFRTEAEAAANLDHPNIVPDYETGEQNGEHYISMKLIDGESLETQIKEEKWRIIESNHKAIQRRMATLIVRTAQAVHHAHQRGVLHRDLKPGNILVDEREEPHVTDFGLAKFTTRDEEGVTVSGVVMGTPNYMPPEQALGDTKLVTTFADIYSLGAVFFKLLTGQPPFQADTTFQTLKQVIDCEPPRPTSFNPLINQDLEIICLKCLEKETSRRYASAEELAADLQRWLNREPILARPATTWERGWKWVRRHPVGVSLSAAIVLSMIIGLVGVTWQWRRAENQSTRLRFQRAEDHFAGDNTHLALAELARLVRDQPANRIAAERLLNALRQRIYFLPSTNQIRFGRQPLQTATNGNRVANILEDEVSVRLADAASGATLFTLSNTHDVVLRSIRFGAGGSLLVTASGDHSARIWDMESKQLRTGVYHLEGIAYAEFSPDGTRVVTASRDATARVWNPTNGQPLSEAMRHLAAVNAAHFSADGKRVVTASDDRTVRLWDAKTGKSVGEPARLLAPVDDASFCPDGSHVAAFCADIIEPRMFKLSGGLVLGPAPAIARSAPTNLTALKQLLAGKHSGELKFIDLSPDGTRVATASSDKTVRLWNARTLGAIAEPLLHVATVNCVRFSPDGLRLVTSTADRMVRVWDAHTGQPLSDWIHSNRPVAGVAFADDGLSIISSAGWRWGFGKVEGIAPEWLAPLAETVAGVRITDRGLPQPVPTTGYLELRQRLLSSSEANELSKWAKEFVGDSEETPGQLSNTSSRAAR